MRVWILMFHEPYEFDVVRGVFSTPELAEAALEAEVEKKPKRAQRSEREALDFDEWTVDEAPS